MLQKKEQFNRPEILNHHLLIKVAHTIHNETIVISRLQPVSNFKKTSIGKRKIKHKGETRRK